MIAEIAMINDIMFIGESKLYQFSYNNEPTEKYKKVDSNELITKFFKMTNISRMSGYSLMSQ